MVGNFDCDPACSYTGDMPGMHRLPAYDPSALSRSPSSIAERFRYYSGLNGMYLAKGPCTASHLLRLAHALQARGETATFWQRNGRCKHALHQCG